MKKIIAISLSIITIIICCYLIVIKMSSLDIPVNKNEWYAMDAIHKIEDRADIDEYEKRVLKERVKQDRENAKRVSNDAFQIQVIAFGVIIIQIFLLIFIVLMPSKNHAEPS
ncbi:uncharacterized protein YxeA [Epilithonimonas hungarica]|uniref:hypothetical protein n=1 Tax=Epilithonimonas hungarica TaxID=454006 RepID=UPI00277E740E|nr:hypothetical protein [Epilithonimonas hungarica]MDP9955412.1 uncharacterized protein YxeA [Epilithonimonas hungarica]